MKRLLTMTILDRGIEIMLHKGTLNTKHVSWKLHDSLQHHSWSHVIHTTKVMIVKNGSLLKVYEGERWWPRTKYKTKGSSQCSNWDIKQCMSFYISFWSCWSSQSIFSFPYFFLIVMADNKRPSSSNRQDVSANDVPSDAATTTTSSSQNPVSQEER